MLLQWCTRLAAAFGRVETGENGDNGVVLAY